MANVQLIKNVLSGSGEYTASVATSGAGGSLEGGEYVEFIFDNDVNIDDIVVSGIGTLDIDIKIFVIYPTGNVQPLFPATGATSFNVTGSQPYRLNADEASRNMWFRVPKWSKLQVQLFSVTVAGAFQISAIARG